jgi:protein TonB
MNLLTLAHYFFCVLGLFGGALISESSWAQGGPSTIGQPMQSGSDEAHHKAKKEDELRRISQEIERRLGAGTRYVNRVTPESSLRDYVQHIKREIEQKGTQSFSKRDGTSVYGRVLMSVTVNAKGQVEQAELLEGTDRFLEAHARNVLKEVVGAPFPTNFPAGTQRIVFLAPFDYQRE